MASIVRGNSLYTIVDGPSWTQAEANAVKLGGHLVSINGSDENLFVQNIAREYFDSKTYYMDGPQKYYLLNGQEQSSDIWIGLVESDGMEGAWTWTTGDPVTYMDTRGLYDDNGTQDYGAIRAIWNWTWDDQENVDTNNILYGRNNVRYSNKVGIAEIPFVQRGDSAYVIVEGPTWEEAEANAVKLGGHLATITDAAENEWIMKNINWIIPGNPSYGAYNSDRLVAYWIGLSDKESEGNYVWSSGNAFSYSQPNWDKYPTPSEDYLTLVSNGEWNDIDSGTNWSGSGYTWWQMKYGIAEIKLTSTTPTPTYSLSPSSTSINEGSTLTTTVSTTNVASGTALYYSLSGTGITSADFSSGSLTGSGTVSSSGSFTFSHTFANDLTTEGTESIQINLYSDSSRSSQVATTTVSISDTSTTPTPTYSLSPSSTSINEGSTLTTTVSTTNVASGTALYYSLSGTGITSADFSSGSLTGSGTVSSGGSFSFSHTLANDLTTEGTESLEIKLYSDSSRSTQVASTSVSINDTSLTPTSNVTVNGTNNGIANAGTINNSGTINTGTINTNSGNTTNNITNTSIDNTNIVYNYFDSTTNNVNSGNTTNIVNSNNTTNNVNSNNTSNSWNIYSVDNSVSVGDITSQWFNDSFNSTKQSVDLTELKLLDITASTWADKILINRVAQASDAGGDVVRGRQLNRESSTSKVGSVLNGGRSNDILKGLAAWDLIDGGSGDDLIHGGNGRDIITGGAGSDELHGDFGWNTYKSEKDDFTDLIAIKSDQFLNNWWYGKAGNSPNGEKADIIEGLDSIDQIKIIGVATSDLSFQSGITHKGVTGIGIYAKGILEAVYTGGDLSVDQISQMTTGDNSATAVANQMWSYWSSNIVPDLLA